MPDQTQYFVRLSAALEKGDPLWQAMVVETEGSTPARVGMKLAVPLSGETFGNLGGGELEYLVINTIRKEQPRSVVKWDYNLDEQGLPHLTEPDGIEQDNGLSGPADPASENKATERIVCAAENIHTSMLCGGSVEVLVEPLFSPYPLYIIGAGHCGRALADFAVKADFQVTVLDNRSDLLQPDAFPNSVHLVHNDYTDLGAAIPFSPHVFIVIMTYGHVHDRQVLESCLRRPFRYLGMIGSAKKVAETVAAIIAKGFSDEELNRLHAPIGLPIGSHTPYEIAVSILAELIQTKNNQ